MKHNKCSQNQYWLYQSTNIDLSSYPFHFTGIWVNQKVILCYNIVIFVVYDYQGWLYVSSKTTNNFGSILLWYYDIQAERDFCKLYETANEKGQRIGIWNTLLVFRALLFYLNECYVLSSTKVTNNYLQQITFQQLIEKRLSNYQKCIELCYQIKIVK